MGWDTPRAVASVSVAVSDGCAIEASVYQDEAVSFQFGGLGGPADIGLGLASLRQFVDLAQRSLVELEKRRKAEDASDEPLEWVDLRLYPEYAA